MKFFERFIVTDFKSMFEFSINFGCWVIISDRFTNLFFFGRSTLLDSVLWNHSHPSVRLSVSPSLRPSLSFLKIGSLVFSDIVHDDSWPWYLVTDKARFLKNKNGGPNLDQMVQNRGRNYVFCHFLKFGWLVFLEFTHNDSFQQQITSHRGKIHEKNFWTQIWAKGTKTGSEL